MSRSSLSLSATTALAKPIAKTLAERFVLLCGLAWGLGGLGGIALSDAAAAPGDAASAPSASEARRSEMDKLPWQVGPAKVAVGSRATLQIPDGTRLLPEAHGGRFLELTGNLPQNRTILVAKDWWAVLGFADSGYIKDDEKLDPDALLKTLKSGDEESNAERKKRGMQQLVTEGWAVAPHFDTASKRLEWGLKLRAQGESEPTINYTVRVLGRKGYESITLVSDVQGLEQNIAQLKDMLKGFEFNGGEKYSEFKAGDHVAEFGLGALVLGGAAAAAAKSGWFKGLLALLAASWKLVAGVVVAGFWAVGKFFKRKPTA